jgi:hypothetical protein
LNFQHPARSRTTAISLGATLVGVNDPGDGQAVSAEIEGHGHIKTDLLVRAVRMSFSSEHTDR